MPNIVEAHPVDRVVQDLQADLPLEEGDAVAAVVVGSQKLLWHTPPPLGPIVVALSIGLAFGIGLNTARALLLIAVATTIAIAFGRWRVRTGRVQRVKAKREEATRPTSVAATSKALWVGPLRDHRPDISGAVSYSLPSVSAQLGARKVLGLDAGPTLAIDFQAQTPSSGFA